MSHMSAILSPLLSRLRQFSQAQLEVIAAEAGVAKTLPRKLACGERDNPTVQTIEPLIEYFNSVDRGERVLPFVPAKAPN
jgi:hypothetical protein